MKENKYRVWDKTKERYCSSVDYINDHGSPAEIKDDSDGLGIIRIKNDRFIFEQFICIKDHEKVDVFEGDILEGKSGIKHIVIYDEWSASFKAKSVVESGWTYQINKAWIKAYKKTITGNIHQNPELAK